MKLPKLKMIEIYGGKDEQWKGWHNLVLDIDGDAGNSKSIQGPIDPETSKQIKEALGIVGEFKIVKSDDYSEFLMKFRRRELELYTNKNSEEFVLLEGVADVKKYCNRLYTKET